MNTPLKLTASAIKTLALPPGKSDYTFFDDEIGGFGLRLRASGSRVWVVQYDHGGRTRRLTLGNVAALDPGKARTEAKELLAKVRLGQDPAAEKAAGRTEAARAAGESFGALLPAYLKHQQASVSPRWYVEIERHLDRQAKALHPHAVAVITLREISGVLDKIAEASGPVASNRCRGSIAAFFQWLASKGYLVTNVAANAGQAATNGKRERVLTDAELVEVWRATEGGDEPGAGQFNSIVRLLLLTGLRRDEISALRWSEVGPDGAVINLPGARTKSGREHVVPLGPTAVAILKAQPKRKQADGSARAHVFGFAEGNGFRNFDGAMNLLRERIEANRRAAGISEAMPHWTLHDLRRTVSTGMNGALGVLPHVVEHVLGHVTAGTAGIYNRAEYVAERRSALQRWDQHVERLVAGKPAPSAKVVKLRRRA